MTALGPGIPEHFLLSSTLWTAREPHRVQTILGSCVAVCLFDEYMKFGGINHYMLPTWSGKGIPSPKYGDVAIERLIEKMVAIGSDRRNLTAKVFGGASQLGLTEAGVSVGTRNIHVAEAVLKSNGIPIIAKSLGGNQGRKILFQSGTGQVFMKVLDSVK